MALDRSVQVGRRNSKLEAPFETLSDSDRHSPLWNVHTPERYLSPSFRQLSVFHQLERADILRPSRDISLWSHVMDMNRLYTDTDERLLSIFLAKWLS